LPNPPTFQTVTLAVAGYVVVSKALRGFQQLRRFYYDWSLPIVLHIDVLDKRITVFPESDSFARDHVDG
jgi:hypothetical protein